MPADAGEPAGREAAVHPKERAVSVVMPTYRRSEFLERAIGTVLGQTHRNLELLVVDDNDPATNKRLLTEAVMEEYGGDRRVRYLKHDRNRGAAAARNTGIRHASAEYVAFLDDDDEWAPEKLARQVEVMEAGGADLAMVYCGYRQVYLESGEERVVVPSKRSHELANLLRANAMGGTSTIMCRRSALIEVGMFDEELPSRQDIDLYVRLSKRYLFSFVPEPLVTWYRHRGEAIGKSRGSAIEAHRRFMDKHAADLNRYPSAYSYRLMRLGTLLLYENRLAEARSAFWQAWRLSPGNAGALLWGLLCNPAGHDLCQWALRLKGRQRLETVSGEMA